MHFYDRNTFKSGTRYNRIYARVVNAVRTRNPAVQAGCAGLPSAIEMKQVMSLMTRNPPASDKPAPPATAWRPVARRAALFHSGGCGGAERRPWPLKRFLRVLTHFPEFACWNLHAVHWKLPPPPPRRRRRLTDRDLRPQVVRAHLPGQAPRPFASDEWVEKVVTLQVHRSG
jgi:hypothetical protein